MPSETVIRALGALIDALANNTAPLWWEMHITLGTAGHAAIAVALDHPINAADRQPLLSAVTRLANLDHA